MSDSLTSAKNTQIWPVLTTFEYRKYEFTLNLIRQKVGYFSLSVCCMGKPGCYRLYCLVVVASADVIQLHPPSPHQISITLISYVAYLPPLPLSHFPCFWHSYSFKSSAFPFSFLLAYPSLPSQLFHPYLILYSPILHCTNFFLTSTLSSPHLFFPHLASSRFLVFPPSSPSSPSSPKPHGNLVGHVFSVNWFDSYSC